MARERSLADMIADIRHRTNMENSEFVTDDEITEFLNQELAELWSHLTQNAGQPFYRSYYDIAVVAGTSLYGLPADFGMLLGVDATIDGITGPLTSFMPLERARMTGIMVESPWGLCSPVRYRVQAGNIEFLPATRSFDAKLWYTPSCPRLTEPSDTFDGFNGFEVAAIYGACAAIKDKEETDSSFYERHRDRIYKHIDSLSSSRDASRPERVQDVMGSLDAVNVWGLEQW
jgi:hypothetical protein